MRCGKAEDPGGLTPVKEEDAGMYRLYLPNRCLYF